MATQKKSRTRLGDCLKLFRAEHGRSIRAMAAEIGVPFPTLSYIEHGRPCDIETYVKVMAWLTKKREAT